MTTVCCVWLRGHVRYTADYVVRLRAMVRQHLSRPHRFVCFTDTPKALPGIETIHVARDHRVYAWWQKLSVFDPANGLSGRVLYLDLDTLIVDGLGPIVDYPAPFALVPTAGKFDGKPPRLVVKRFNSSVMVWNAGEQSHLFTDWTLRVSERLWGDQDWIGEQAPDAATMPAAWFPRLSDVKDGPTPEAKVVLCKVPKNDKAARRIPWVARVWRAA